MLGRRTRITYTNVGDFAVVGVLTIRPLVVRGLLAAPLAAIAVLFLVTVPAAKSMMDSLWLCTFVAVFIFLTIKVITVPRTWVTPASPEFAKLPAYRDAVAVHVTELETLLDAADAAVPLSRRARKRVDRVVRQTQYVATLFLLAARAESLEDAPWWSRLHSDDAVDLQQVLAEQDSALIQLRRDVRAELRVRQPV